MTLPAPITAPVKAARLAFVDLFTLILELERATEGDDLARAETAAKAVEEAAERLHSAGYDAWLAATAESARIADREFAERRRGMIGDGWRAA